MALIQKCQWLVGIIYLSTWFYPSVVRSQLIPDNTLPENTVVSSATDGRTFNIEGGTIGENKLFHSFEAFSVPTQTSVIFQAPPSINILLTRVTGNGLSSIDGLINVEGNADFFLLNPNGIIFGENASLDVSGSFIASTAESIEFGENQRFDIQEPFSEALLSVDIPTGLQFGRSPGKIINQSIRLGTSGLQAGLAVQSGETIALLGGGIEIPNGRIVSPGSHVHIASVSSGSQIGFEPSITGYKFSHNEVESFEDINISRLAEINSSGDVGGLIEIVGANINISDGSTVISNTLGDFRGQGIKVRASNIFSIDGAGPIDGPLDSQRAEGGVFLPQRTRLAVGVLGNGSSEPLSIQAKTASVSNGAVLDTDSSGSGRGANIYIRTSERVEVIEKSDDLIEIIQPLKDIAISLGLDELFLGEVSTASLISIANTGTGSAGELQIHTERLVVRDGGLIAATPLSLGAGGAINIEATESVELSGVPDNEIYSPGITLGSLSPSATGAPGDLIITTPILNITGGSGIGLSSASESGLSGTFNTSEINIIGDSPTGIWPSSISAISSVSGTGGQVNLRAQSLRISKRGVISAAGANASTGGDLNISVGSVLLEDHATITTASSQGLGGNINLDIDGPLLIRRDSQISARAGASGTGGNISINADLIAAPRLENNDIIATAVAGAGGEINITTQGIIGLQTSDRLTPNSDISASSEVGLDGNVSINSPDTELDSTQIELDEAFAPPKLAAGCYSTQATSGRFVLTGRGGLPENPTSHASLDGLWQDLEPLPTSSLRAQQIAISPQSATPLNKPVIQSTPIEASAWKLNNKGKIQLVAMAEDEMTLPAAPVCISQ